MFKIDVDEFISKQKLITYLSNYKKDMLEYITVFKDKPDCKFHHTRCVAKYELLEHLIDELEKKELEL